METSGQGEKLSFSSELLVIGDNALTNVFQVFNKVNFAGLIFALDNNYLFDFDEDTGIFTFKRTGSMQILATLNFGATGLSEVQVSPVFKRGLGPWTYLNARRGGLPITGQNHIFMSGSVNVIKGDLIRFDIRATNALASFDTEILPNTSQIPAAVLDFLLFIR